MGLQFAFEMLGLGGLCGAGGAGAGCQVGWKGRRSCPPTGLIGPFFCFAVLLVCYVEI